MNPNIITLPITELKSALTGLGKVINQKANLPVLLHVKIERTSDGWIALTGTDLDRFITMRLEHPSEGPPLTALIPYELLLQFARSCGKNEQIHIDVTPKGTLIKFPIADKLGESKVPTLPAEDFPVTPRIKGDSMPLNPELRRSLLEAMQCSSVDTQRYVLNSALIDTSNPNANYIVGTDGTHLYSANSFSLPLKNSVIIPSHKFIGWKEFNLDGEWQMKADTVMLQISSRRWRFITRQIPGKYPDWRMTIPNSNDVKTTITLDPAKLDKLINLIQRMPCHDEIHQRIGLQWCGGQFNLIVSDSGQDSCFNMPIPDSKGQGKEVTILMDRRYFIKALQYGLNTISLIDERSPLKFHNQGKQMVVMPIRPVAHKVQPPAQPEPAIAPVPPPVPNQERNPTMINRPAPEEPQGSTGNTSPTIEEVIASINQIRDKLAEPLNQLRELSMKLKFIDREQKSNAREFNAVRSTLRSLQTMKL